jgi:hypothetical protein
VNAIEPCVPKEESLATNPKWIAAAESSTDDPITSANRLRKYLYTHLDEVAFNNKFFRYFASQRVVTRDSSLSAKPASDVYSPDELK